MTVNLATLLVRQTKETIFGIALNVGEALGLPVTTWREGDPTRSTYWVLAELGEAWVATLAQFCASGFLDYAEGDWLTLLAKQGFNVDRVEATRGVCLATLTNAGGVSRTIEPRDLTFRNSTTGKTYTNTTGGTVPAGGTLPNVELEADEAGSESNAAIGEVDELVTTVLGLSVANTTVATGLDEQPDPDLRTACREKLGALSPNGPRDGYSYFAKQSTPGVTRTRPYDDSDTGDVLLYLAGPGGAVSSDDLALATTAVLENATPLCITPTVASATNLSIPIAYELWVYDLDGRDADELEEAVEEAIATLFANKAIGGDIIPPATSGAFYASHIAATIKSVSTHAFRVDLATPAASATAMLVSQVATPGAITATVNVVAAP